MFTRPPEVTDADVVAVLADGWGLETVSIDYLAVGFGSHHWRATTKSADWFVTIDDLAAKRQEPDEAAQRTHDRLVAALTTAVGLGDAGFEFVVAPRRTTGGDIVRRLGDRYVVAVYTDVAGETYAYGSYTDATHRDAVVGHLAALHSAPAPCRWWAWTDTFSISRRTELFAACSHLHDTWDTGPFASPARQLLAEHVDALTRAFDTYDALAAVVSSQRERLVLTHGEPHRANTITTDRGVVLVDWDTALIAPPERDLWELVGEEPSVAMQYETLTGTRVDRDAIELYRLAWDLNEIAGYVSDFRQPHERTEDSQEAWQNLQHFLDPARW